MPALYGAPALARSCIPRSRVTAMFRPDASIVIVRAGAGRGKTVAVAQWAAAAGIEGVWITVDAACSARTAFWTRIVQRLSDGGFLTPSNSLAQAAGSLPSGAALYGLLERGLLQLTRPVHLVIDDGHLLQDAQILHELAALAARTPLRAVLITRMQSELELESLQLAYEPCIITSRALRFDRDETAQLLGLSSDDARVSIFAESSHGSAALALRHAIAADDFELATEIAVDSWYPLLFELGAQTEELLSSVPLPRLRAYPLLAMLLALYYFSRPALRARGAELYRSASLGLRGRRSRDRVEQVLLGVLEGIARLGLGDGESALAAYFHTDALLHSLEADQLARLGANLPAVMTQLAIGYFYAGRPDRCTELLERVHAMPVSLNERERLHALALLTGFSAARGEIVPARAYLEQARRERWRDEWLNGYLGTQLHLGEAAIAIEDGDFAAAQAALGSIPAELRDGQHRQMIGDMQAVIGLGTGRLAQAIAAHSRLIDTEGFRELTPQCQAWALGCQAVLVGAAGRVGEARRIIGRADPRFPMTNIVAGALEYAAGSPAAAIARVAQISIADVPSIRVQVEARLVLAACAFKLERMPEVETQLSEALALMARHGMRNPYFAVSLEVVSELLEWAREPGNGFAEQLARVMPPLANRGVPAETAPAGSTLSEREQVVLAELATENSRAQIAATLFVSENTVKTQIRALYRKLGVWSREEAVREARTRGLLPDRGAELV